MEIWIKKYDSTDWSMTLGDLYPIIQAWSDSSDPNPADNSHIVWIAFNPLAPGKIEYILDKWYSI